MRRNLLLAPGLCVALAGLWLACSNDEPVAPESAGTSSGEPDSPGLYLAPIEGLTTAWHPLPAHIAVPRDIVLTFRYLGPPEATITWDGADVVDQGPGVSTASCPAGAPGVMGVTVHAARPDGNRSRSCRIEVIDVSAADITVRDIALYAPQPDFGGHTKPGKDPGVQGTSINEMTMELFFKDESIGSLVEVEPGRYVTSVHQELKLAVQVDPPALASLMEWRVNGHATTLGANATVWLPDRSTYQIAVGPTKNPPKVTVETYTVEIASYVSDIDPLVDDVPVTLTARTTPAGYEQYVTWLASTKYGASDPIVGQGESFTVTFANTWGPRLDGEPGAFRWLGVKADDVVFDLDQKTAPKKCQFTSTGAPVLFGGCTQCPVAGAAEVFYLGNCKVDADCPNVGGMVTVTLACDDVGTCDIPATSDGCE